VSPEARNDGDGLRFWDPLENRPGVSLDLLMRMPEPIWIGA
jgi:hypothetical protein